MVSSLVFEAYREAANSHVALARGKREKIDYSARFNGLTNRRIGGLSQALVRTLKRPLDSNADFTTP